MMAIKRLAILLAGKSLGNLEQSSGGDLSIAYEPDYAGAPLSLSMPVGNRVYGDKVVRPYLFGLLPDGFEQRRTLGREFGVSPNNPFQLLRFVGLDCPGAVQFCDPDLIDEVVHRAGDYIPITDDEIGDELSRIEQDGFPSWQAPNEHWSLGGAQPKLALAQLEGSWYRCEGAAATTHILKPGIRHLKSEALNEALCLQLARLAGVPAAHAMVRAFGGESPDARHDAIVVKRFDRVFDGRRVRRLHQEDFCQALSVLPENKYTSEGGPSARDIVGLLGRYPHAERNKLVFAEELFFNYLVGAPDAHAKNYSVLLDADGPHMAPLYDCASGIPYRPDRGQWTMAMGIGRETNFGHVGEGNIRRFANAASLDADQCIALMGNLAIRIIETIGHAFASMEQVMEVAGVQDGQLTHKLNELRERLEPGIIDLCEMTLRQL